jgi:hypothetical protein
MQHITASYGSGGKQSQNGRWCFVASVVFADRCGDRPVLEGGGAAGYCQGDV